MLPVPDTENDFLADHAALLISSYRQFTGKDLVAPSDNPRDTCRALYEANIAVVSHDTQSDPVFNYANLAAQTIFEMDWAAFTQLPSRLSVEPGKREERERLMAGVKQHGYIDDYSGVRISATGKRFAISNATVWNLIDEQGVYRGQAAMFAL